MLYELLLIIYCLLFTILSWRNAKLSLALLIFALPTYLIRFKIFSIPFTLLEAMIWIVFIVWLIRNYKKPIITAYRWPIILLLLVAAVAIEISPNTFGALGIFKAYFLEPIMFFLVFINAIKDKKDLQPIVYALGWSALLISALAIYQKFTGWAIPNEFWAAEDTRRVTSFFGYPNAIGLYLGPIIILYTGQLFQWKKIWPTSCHYEPERSEGVIIPWIIARLSSRGIATPPPKAGARNDSPLIIFNSLVIIASLLSIIFAVSKGALVGVFAGLSF